MYLSGTSAWNSCIAATLASLSSARAVGGQAAGHVQAREGEHVLGAGGDEAGRAERAGKTPRRRDDLLVADVDVADRRAVEDRVLGQRHGVGQPERLVNSRSRMAASQVLPVTFSITRPSIE